jgi:glyoxylase-like metal-dependent hydrolase (beta-lactamase superfamily II)
VFPGVTAIPCHGHTPGHTSFLISSGNEQLLIWGDTVHVPEIQTAREVCMEFDTDPAVVAPARVRLVATDRLAITGMHLHFPGFAHLVRRGFSKSRWKSAASLRGKHQSLRRTAHFGGKPLIVGKSNFARPKLKLKHAKRPQGNAQTGRVLSTPPRRSSG